MNKVYIVKEAWYLPYEEDNNRIIGVYDSYALAKTAKQNAQLKQESKKSIYEYSWGIEEYVINDTVED